MMMIEEEFAMKISATKKSSEQISSEQVPPVARAPRAKLVAKPRRIVKSPPGKGLIPLSVIRRAVAEVVARHKK